MPRESGALMATDNLQRRSRRQNWAIIRLVVQILAALVAWMAAWHSVETILATGPSLAVAGLALALLVRQRGTWTPLLFALSAPAVCALGAFAIACFHLGPPEAYRPILTLLTIYLVMLLPAAIVVFIHIRRWPTLKLAVTQGTWRYSLRSLLTLMTVVAICTAALATALRSISEPFIFAAFGSAAMVLMGLVVWRFFVYRRLIQSPLMPS